MSITLTVVDSYIERSRYVGVKRGYLLNVHGKMDSVFKWVLTSIKIRGVCYAWFLNFNAVG